MKSKEHAKKTLERGIARLAELQGKLYAQDRWAILLILQAMDAAGKDSTIKHVMSGVNPQGCQVTFVQDSLHGGIAARFFVAHIARRCRSAGRSAFLTGLTTRKFWWFACIRNCWPAKKYRRNWFRTSIWQKRFEDINAFERYLTGNGIVVLKFFLHLSKKEQKKRFLERLDDPEKNWKFSVNDALERQHWDKYMHAYEDMIRNTSTKHAPVVRCACRSQMVHAVGGGRSHHRRAGEFGSFISQNGRGKTERFEERARTLVRTLRDM